MIDQVLDTWDGVDVLVNNAGIQGPLGRAEAVDPEAWMQTVQVNLGGCFYCTRKVLPAMMAQKYGKIINLSGGGAVGLVLFGGDKAQPRRRPGQDGAGPRAKRGTKSP